MDFVNVMILAFVWVFIIDLSGIINEMERGLAKWLHMKSAHIPKPFSCSLCMSWWTSIIYFLVVGNFTVATLGFSALVAFLTPVMNNILIIVKDTLIRALDTLRFK